MIMEKYRLLLPPYWYENQVAEYHFEGAGGETNLQNEKIQNLGNQFILKSASYALNVWEWIYFGETQIGTLEKRRSLIRKQYRTKSRFTIATLKALGREYGDLDQIKEDFVAREVIFDFFNTLPIDLPQLKKDFNDIRPVHVNGNQASVKNKNNLIGLNPNIRLHINPLPVCGIVVCTPEEV